MRTVSALLLCVPLAGCAVTMYGNQSTSGGTTTMTTSSQVSGSAQGANYKASFSSGGRPVSPKAPGGYVSVSGNSAYVLIGVVAPALPRPALVFLDRFVLEHAPHQRGHVGLVALGPALQLPLLAEREDGGLQDFP